MSLKSLAAFLRRRSPFADPLVMQETVIVVKQSNHPEGPASVRSFFARIFRWV